MAQALRSSVRTADNVVRWGGEEFLIILLGSGLVPAQELAERIRLAIAAQIFSRVERITLSLGVGGRSPGETVTDLLRRTDVALYTAKGRGQNQVALAPA